MDKEEFTKLYKKTLEDTSSSLLEMIDTAQTVKGNEFTDFSVYVAQLLRLTLCASVNATEHERKSCDLLFWSLLESYALKCQLDKDDIKEAYELGYKIVQKTIRSGEKLKDEINRMEGNNE